MSGFAGFIAELQRRSVIRAAIVHVLVFWLLVQVADVVLPYIGIVDEPVRWAVVAGVGLFPVTLVVAWFYEHPWTKFTRGRLATDVILIVLIGAGASTWALRNLPQVVHTRTSIVVLPFENSGSVTEESLSRALASEVNSLLMRSKSIDVIGIESATSPALKGLKVPAVAERLSVQHVLSGTIAAQGESLRIDLQLFDSAGAALWDSVIEDRLENLFSIQEDIAVSIESLLGAGDDTVPVAEVAAARCWMPNDPEAIEKFYTARYYTELRTETEDANQKLRDAIQYYKDLIADYPEFAEAYSGLAWAQLYQVTYDRENALPVEDAREDGRRLGALALQYCPTLGEAMHHTFNEFDHPNHWIGEHQQLTAFIEMEPERSENYQRLAFHYRMTGHFDRALEVSRGNYERNPLSVRSIREYASALQHYSLEESAAMRDLATELGYTGPNFARLLMPLDACDRQDVDCVIAVLPSVFPPPFDRMLFDGWEELFRTMYKTPADEAEAAAAVEAAMTIVRKEPNFANWLNGAACNYDHLAPLFFELLEYVKAEGDISRQWFWANAWGEDCGNVWADPRFRDYVEEFDFLEYWREVGWAEACRPDGDSYVCGAAE